MNYNADSLVHVVKSAGQTRPRYSCVAHNCPMPGTIFAGADQHGVCAWHYGTHGSDWPRITQALNDWQCVSFEVNECRRVHTDQHTSSRPEAQESFFRVAWERLQPLVAGGWEEQLQPQPSEDYGRWRRRLEAFLGARVVEVVRHQVGRRAA